MTQLDDIRAHLAMLRCDLDSPDVRHLRRLVEALAAEVARQETELKRVQTVLANRLLDV